MIKCKQISSLSHFSTHLKSSPPPLSTIFRTLWQSATEDNNNSNNNKWSISHYIIDDKNLLRPSFTSTGLHVLDLINNGSLQPNRTIYNKLLKRCTMLGKLKQGKLVHAHIVDSELKHDLVIQNSILFMYAKCGNLELARQVFDEMSVKDVVSWTSMITGYSQNERVSSASSALVLFPEMIRHGSKPNEFTLSSLVKCCGFMHSYVDGKQIHGCCWKYGFHSNVFVGSSLVDMCARCGYVCRNGRNGFNDLWSSLVDMCARCGCLESE